MDVTTRCRACSKEMTGEATRCPHCRARTVPMHRGEGRALLGVCSALARELDVDPALVRVAFVLMFFASGGMSAGLYLLLWAFIPARAYGRAPLQGPLDWVSKVANAPVDDDTPRWEKRV
ncbi:PspC domain-containing protein [Corallococcus exercitus]|uniref:PspC domain-containing protein n=1 Tax=Corallococcus exercitus TaxID=2316736 RepID=A0A7Y4KFY5_9BACT|nr:PspC domain-containing protein [Corallococcus exercitus]NOK31984.1 PspC domain-containing protein [Corallococcus exercitus]